MLDKVRFEFGTPALVALKYSAGKEVAGQFGDQVFFTLDDGRCMYVEPEVAEQIEALAVEPGEPIEILKRRVPNGRSKPLTKWEVRRADEAPAEARDLGRPVTAPSGEKMRPEQHPHSTPLARQLEQSIAVVEQQKAAQPPLAQVLGPSAGALFELCGYAAVDAAAKVAAYALKAGLIVSFGAEDVRCLWNSFYIQATKQGGSTWRN